MDKSGWIFITFLYILGTFIISCQAKEDKSITCYQCNSEYDPRCGDPFDPYSLGTVNCSMKKPLEHMKDTKPMICRKTIQKVQGHTRIIRGCGYVTDERDDKKCMRRTGTHDVQIHYCSCTKNLCNSAFSNKRPSIIFIAILTTLAGLTRLV